MSRVGYVRVSSLDQNTARQLDGMVFDEIFMDKASGKDTKRPQLQAALAYLQPGDTLYVHSMDRLARDLEDLLRLIRELTERGVTIEFVTENRRFSGVSNPIDNLVLGVLGTVAQFERAKIRERQLEGIAIAKANGVYKGRKPALDHVQVSALRSMLLTGEKVAAVAKAFHVSRQSVYRYAG